MFASTRSQILVTIIAFLSAAYIWVFGAPFLATAAFTVLCLVWSAWIFISVFRGTDELKTAGIRYALAVASGVGVPLSVAFVMLMVAIPGVQQAITSIAMSSRSGLSPAPVGFALGVSFTFVTMCAVFALSHSVWWFSKR